MNLTEDQVFEYACHEGNYALPVSWPGRAPQMRKALITRQQIRDVDARDKKRESQTPFFVYASDDLN